VSELPDRISVASERHQGEHLVPPMKILPGQRSFVVLLSIDILLRIKFCYPRVAGKIW